MAAAALSSSDEESISALTTCYDFFLRLEEQLKYYIHRLSRKQYTEGIHAAYGVFLRDSVLYD